jgi:hypothetical protein
MSLEQLSKQQAPESSRRSGLLSRWKRHATIPVGGNGIVSNSEEGNTNPRGLMTTEASPTLPVGILLTTEHLPESMRYRDLPGMGQSPKDSVTVLVETSRLKPREEFSTNMDHPVNKKYWDTVVLPRFEEVAERNLHGKSCAEREEYVGGLIDAYTAVERYPDNTLGQINELRRIAVSDEYLLPVKDILPDLQASRQEMFGEFNMVTNLAQLDSMIDVFTDDAYAQFPELQNKTRSEAHPAGYSTRKERDGIITSHVTGLLGAYLSSETDFPDQGYYGERFVELQDALAEKKTKIETESLRRSDAESRRIILRTSKHFKSYEDTLSLEEQAGLAEYKVKEAKAERRKEYAKSTGWFIGIEGGQIGLGWALGDATAQIFDLKSLIAVGALALAARAASSRLLWEKQKESVKTYERTGVAPDPVEKYFGDRFGKPELGFALAHWPTEGVYAGVTALAMKVLGSVPGLATEIAADALSIPRQIEELIEMKMDNEETNLNRREWVMQKSKEKVEKTKAKVKNIGRHILRKDSQVAVDASTIDDTESVVVTDDTHPDVVGSYPPHSNSTGETVFMSGQTSAVKPGVNA